MKLIFVDAENIGLKELDKIEASIVDKVFVFSKQKPIAQLCEKKLFLCLSDYPCGANQADFYIIAYLIRVMSSLDKKQLASIKLSLFSNDENLISAFKFQCALLGGKPEIVRTKSDIVVPIPLPQTPKDRIYNALQVPKTLDPNFQKQLGISKSDFTRAINELAKTNKIQRTKESKKKWVSV